MAPPRSISIVVFLGDAHLHSLGAGKPAVYTITEGMLGLLIGCVSFSGSAIAFIKLQELITGRPITYPGQQVINGLVGLGHRRPRRGHDRDRTASR